MKKSLSLNEVAEFENILKNNNYNKMTKYLSDNETFGYFKSIKDENGETQYMIEYRFWDFSKYSNRNTFFINTPYSIDILIIDNSNGGRVDLGITDPIFEIEKTEKLAAELHKLILNFV